MALSKSWLNTFGIAYTIVIYLFTIKSNPQLNNNEEDLCSKMLKQGIKSNGI